MLPGTRPQSILATPDHSCLPAGVRMIVPSLRPRPQAVALLALGLLAFPPSARADPLTASDRQLLLERLANLKNAAEGQNSTRVSAAIAPFRAAMTSNDGAIALYLKCIEKLDFDEKSKSSQDFRNWKRRQNDKLKDTAFRLALRHQLQWLTLTLEASLRHGDFAKMAPKASDALTAIFAHTDELGGQMPLLRQSVLSSVFARAYHVSYVDPGDWPTAPLAIAKIYDKVILPPLRNPKSLDYLRTAWQNRILQEGLLRESGRRQSDSGGNGRPLRDLGRSTSYEKFLIDERPDLLWQMEVDLFRAGDQRKAALRMLDHLEHYQSHPKAADWAQDFIDLISPPKPKTE